MTDQVLAVAVRGAVLQPSLNGSALFEAANARKELLESIDKIVDAIRDNQAIQRTAQGLKDKGAWASLKGAISGANDKDLAGMVKALGGSLETTQAVIQVMLRLQTRKEHFLREFHSVLVDKIIKIQTDTKTLDSNQRAAALEIVSALQDQVEDQLLQYETVDQHELRLSAIDDELSRSSVAEGELRQSLRNLDDQLSCNVDALHRGLKAHEEKLGAEIIAINARTQETLSVVGEIQKTWMVNLASIRASQEELRNSIKYEQQQQKLAANAFYEKLEQIVVREASLEKRLDQIGAHLAARSTWIGRLQQHSIGIAALLVALIAVTYSVGV